MEVNHSLVTGDPKLSNGNDPSCDDYDLYSLALYNIFPQPVSKICYFVDLSTSTAKILNIHTRDPQKENIIYKILCL